MSSIVSKLRRIPVEYRAVAYRVLLLLSAASFVTSRVAGDDIAAVLDVAAVLLGVSGTGLAAANTPRAGRR